MNPLWIVGWVVSMETVRAENRVMKALSSPPAYRVTGELVSVIIPAYNEENYLPSLLQALKNQTYSNIEVIVVDNESEDRTTELAKNMGAFVCSNDEFNLSLSRNIGARFASGSILVFIDADTIPEQVAIERVVEEINNGAILVYTNKCCTDNHVQSLLRVSSGMVTVPMLGFNGCFMGVRKDAFVEEGGFDETYLTQEGHTGEDREFGSRLSKYGVSYLRDVFVGTSARRQIKEGYLVTQHFQERAIR